MIILSIDSAGTGCGAAVWRDGDVLAEQTEAMERGQDQRLMPLILDVMKKAGVDFGDLDRIAVTRGPGSFTGLRIGLAAARGIGLAASKPVIGIDRFSIFHAQAAEPGKNLLVVINSRRKELFCRFYPAQSDAAEATMMTEDEIRDFLAATSNTMVAGDIGVAPFRSPTEKEVVTAAKLAALADRHDPAFLPRPLYIRAPDVTMKKPAPVIEPVFSQHAPILAAIHAASFGPAAWSVEQISGSLALETTKGWALFEGGQPVGFILCQILPEQAEILTFAVHPGAQRRGFGERLLKKAIESLKNGRIFLEVAEDNQAATRLYEKLRFRRSGIRPNYYTRDGKTVDAVMYEKTPPA